MKALTILQPHAAAIVEGEKLVEFRSWQTHYRGWLAIHAGTRVMPGRGEFMVRYNNRMVEAKDLPKRCIVAMAQLVQVLDSDAMLPLAARTCLHARYLWVLANVEPLDTPYECPGQQGLWPLTIKQTEGITLRLPESSLFQNAAAAWRLRYQ